MVKRLLFIFLLFGIYASSSAQHSYAREWNDQLLDAIRTDFARPTVHARNLFHSSVVMYDCWALFDDTAETVFLGKTYAGFSFAYNGIADPEDKDAAIKEMMSYAVYRLLLHRFQFSPGASTSIPAFNALMTLYGYDVNFTSTDYSTGSYAALGNYFAEQVIAFGNQDGSNEQNLYENQYYSPVNPALPLQLPSQDTNDLIDPNRWQPLEFGTFIDQSGNEIPGQVPPFLNPEWGQVIPFCLKTTDLDILNNGFESYVYNDPGDPVFVQNSNENGIEDPYKWHFSLVVSWSSHLDPNDNTMIDISPASLGNVDVADYPSTFEDYKAFYNFTDGGDIGAGRDLNPSTGAPYTQQMVKRSDYARVLAEFWADGPESETPPGHWFTILNYVSDHPLVEKKIGGQGDAISDLEWDVKSYLTLGGAMHDAAVNTWGIKGYYDYIRPVSAIRYMAGKGQSSDASKPSYDPHGLPLIPGLIELVEVGDPLTGGNDEHVGKLKIYAWRGPLAVSNPDTDAAGVDWILASDWWPYQRPTFVTPPFAGYVSGHSTFSRAAAEVMTLLTGDEFFPGGMGTFDVTENEFLVFEEGPTQSFTLQWATYRDASDQTSLSRIWGGIHPPIDDIRGRIIGEKIGNEAYELASEYFNEPVNIEPQDIPLAMYPVPFKNILNITLSVQDDIKVFLYDYLGRRVLQDKLSPENQLVSLNTSGLSNGVYFVKLIDNQDKTIAIKKVLK